MLRTCLPVRARSPTHGPASTHSPDTRAFPTCGLPQGHLRCLHDLCPPPGSIQPPTGCRASWKFPPFSTSPLPRRCPSSQPPAHPPVLLSTSPQVFRAAHHCQHPGSVLSPGLFPWAQAPRSGQVVMGPGSCSDSTGPLPACSHLQCPRATSVGGAPVLHDCSQGMAPNPLPDPS